LGYKNIASWSVNIPPFACRQLVCRHASIAVSAHRHLADNCSFDVNRPFHALASTQALTIDNFVIKIATD
jgi:hypothetical protein